MDHKDPYDQMRMAMPRLRTTAQMIKTRRRRKRIERLSKLHLIMRIAAALKFGYVPVYLTAKRKA